MQQLLGQGRTCSPVCDRLSVQPPGRWLFGRRNVGKLRLTFEQTPIDASDPRDKRSVIALFDNLTAHTDFSNGARHSASSPLCVDIMEPARA
jgi:hypothetical protein